MTDVAALGLQVDSGPVVQGTSALKGLTTAAQQAEAAAVSLAGGAQTVGAATTTVTTSATQAAASLIRQASAAEAATSSMINAANASRRLASNNNILHGQTANIAAQFQDIAVQLQAGQSPFVIALQQGTQLSAVLGATGGGLRGILGALGGAFASLISPISLITIGLIAAGGALVEYFTNASEKAEEADVALRKHISQIKSVALEWADSVPGLKEYVDELERAQNISDLKLAGGEKIAADLGEINAALNEFITNNQDIVDALNLAYDATGRTDTALGQFASSWQELVLKIKDGTATEDDFSNALALLGPAMKESGGDLDAFGTMFETFAGRIQTALGALQEFQIQMRDALNTGIKIQSQIQDLTTGQIGKTDLPDPNFRLPFIGPLPGSRPNIELEGLPGQKFGASSQKQSAYASATRSIQEQTSAIQAQNAAQAALNPLVNDYSFSLTKAKASADLLAAAEKDKKAITPELTADINAQATALANATVEQNKLAEATKNAKENLEFMKSSATGFLETFRQGITSGESAMKAFGEAALTVLDKIASKIEDTFVNSLFDPGGILGSLFKVGGTSSDPWSGLRTVSSAPTAAAAANAVSAPSAVSSAAVRAALPRVANAPRPVMAQGQGVHITVGLKKNGLNIEPEVVDVARSEAGKAAGAVQNGFDLWLANGFHRDWENHAKNRRIVGRSA